MAFADYTSRGAVAVITLKNPPVNALSVGLRTAIADGLERAANDASIGAVVIAGSATAFCGGADVGEFGLPAMSARPSLTDLLLLVETSPKPVVAAISGLALGGGLELCMACHYRVAAGGGTSRNARGQAGTFAGRGRYAAAAAPGGCGARAQHDRERQAGACPRTGADGFARLDGGWRCVAGGHRPGGAHHRREIAAEESPRRESRSSERRGVFRSCTRRRCAARQALPGAAQMHRRDRGGRRQTVRRGNGSRAVACSSN